MAVIKQLRLKKGASYHYEGRKPTSKRAGRLPGVVVVEEFDDQSMFHPEKAKVSYEEDCSMFWVELRTLTEVEGEDYWTERGHTVTFERRR